MSIIYSILFIYFLSAFGEIIAWICVILLQLAFIGAAGGSYFMWDASKAEMQDKLDSGYYENQEQ